MPNESYVSSDGLEYYADCMQEIGFRTDKIGEVFERALQSKKFFIADIEFIALNMRKILELIVFANLSANIEEYSKARQQYSKDWSIIKIIKRIRGINPDFYPRPIEKIVHTLPSDNDRTHHISFEYLQGGFLTESELQKVDALTSDILHVHNPFKVEKRNPSDEMDKLYIYFKKIERLLRNHQMHLVNGDMIQCDMKSEFDGKLWVVYMKSLPMT